MGMVMGVNEIEYEIGIGIETESTPEQKRAWRLCPLVKGIGMRCLPLRPPGDAAVFLGVAAEAEVVGGEVPCQRSFDMGQI